MGNHLDSVSDNIAKTWQKALRYMKFLRKMNQDPVLFPSSSGSNILLQGYNLTGKGETYLTSLLSGFRFFFPEKLSLRC